MIKTNTKENRKIIKIFITLCLISILCLILNLNTVRAETTLMLKQTTSNEQNYQININDEAEVSETIKNLILTINSEGMNKNFLSQTIELYTQLTERYTNNEIIDIIEQNKNELKENNVNTENINSVIKILKNIDTNNLRKILSQIDVDELATKINNGESAQSILFDITGEMTTAEKVNFVVDILLAARNLKIILIILIILFIYRTLLRCVIYKKAGKKAWAPFVPIYRNVAMLKICGMSPWWLLLLLIPVVGWILLFIVSVASKFMLAEAFGKGTVFAFGLWLLAPIFETIIVFSKKTKYIGFEE